MFLRFSIPVPAHRAIHHYGQSREIIAASVNAIDDAEFVQHLLWIDEHKIPRSGLAPFRYTSSKRGQGLDIVAIGQQAVEALLSKGHLLSKAVCEHFGTAPSDGREMGMCSVQASRTLVHYWIPRMVVQKYQYEGKFLDAEKDEKTGKPSSLLREHVANVIRRDLVRQAELMTIDIPQDIEIWNVRLDCLKPVKVVDGRYNLSARVRFTMSHKLEGHWAVGHLAARGYGRILREYHLK
jgi:hypothetical protein